MSVEKLRAVVLSMFLRDAGPRQHEENGKWRVGLRYETYVDQIATQKREGTCSCSPLLSGI
jgi:hypothetical protein